MSTSPGDGRRIHLVRHGEVHNPRHVVYADLPGYGLSALGRAQAAEAAGYLVPEPLETVVSSPLERAVATADVIAARHGLAVVVDDRLTEWRMGLRWAGVVWEDLPVERPGELEAYLATPHALEFASESLDELSERMIDAIASWSDRATSVALVSHQDPVQAARRRATGGSFAHFHQGKPGHASVTTLRRATKDRWSEARYWEPDQGRAFPPVTRVGE